MQDCLDLVKAFEGFSSTPYLCPAGVWTIGYGTTRYPDGTRVQASDSSITEEKALEYLSDALRRSQRHVLLYTKATLLPNQLDALTSFLYNVGAGAYRASTLLRKLNRGEYEEVPYELARWNKAGGRVLRGLIRRREAEIALWLREDV